MSDNKKYYYLKLKDNFFDRKEIKIIRAMDQGDTYVSIMLEMYLKSLERHGLLMVTDTIPYDLKSLTAVLCREEAVVKYAIELFLKYDLIKILDGGELYMLEIQNFIGHSSTEADRIRSYRKELDGKIAISSTNVQQMYNIRTPKNKDKRLKTKDKEKD